ncbi:cupin domain-containing protein [Shewanella fidelis]|uniref:Cupin domain-containing protein n=1 Tax=Shewanella fidelis TaxID=173509 RepID=A0AAW8NT45_9GAMM|nr:cupin domain-containing protein [Shewanella fidelis]MDR8525064.1 cupin domain-containing protein [Shewanella fidelis]MDW4811135.1 cupin domain-containing protein [Shewanella fidelis]MDW4815086.1 cupin domain-containing protein [Shewanella fidelis]MDW4819176.1 cupin domain-containing protein [Shewanella fidelis]MDW4823146.1 cupin domain-containing protein [Shewanella fidelis]
MQKNNLLTDLPVDLTQEVFEPLVKTEQLLIERIVSKAHVTPQGQWYDQERNEWVMVMQGAARLEFIDGKFVNLQVGEHLNIPAHVKHRVAWTSEEVETIWLAVHY